jgi:hypothetical protein
MQKNQHVSAPSAGYFGCRPRTLLTIYRYRRLPEGAILASNHWEYGECRLF